MMSSVDAHTCTLKASGKKKNPLARQMDECGARKKQSQKNTYTHTCALTRPRAQRWSRLRYFFVVKYTRGEKLQGHGNALQWKRPRLCSYPSHFHHPESRLNVLYTSGKLFEPIHKPVLLQGTFDLCVIRKQLEMLAPWQQMKMAISQKKDFACKRIINQYG